MDLLKGFVLFLALVAVMYLVFEVEKTDAQTTAHDHKIGQCFDKHYDNHRLDTQAFLNCVKS